MSQLYTALKDFDGLEEIDRALGIPALVEQVRSFLTYIITFNFYCFLVTFYDFFFYVCTCFFMFLWLPVSDPNTGAGPVSPGPLHDVRPKAPHVHPAIWSPTIPHGPKGLPWCPHARARLPPHAWPDWSTARLPHDEDAGPARTQADRGRPQPAQHTTTAAPAPAPITAGTRASRVS